MSNFINNLLTRHAQPDSSARPRARGRFEPVADAANSWIKGESLGNDVETATSEIDNEPPTRPLDKSLEEQPDRANTDKFVAPPQQRLLVLNNKELFHKQSSSDNNLNKTPIPTLVSGTKEPGKASTPPGYVRSASENTPILPEPVQSKSERILRKKIITTPEEETFPKIVKPLERPVSPDHSNTKVNQQQQLFEPQQKAEQAKPKLQKINLFPTGEFPDIAAPVLPKQQQAAFRAIEPQPTPTIQINIGRIEVRAVVEKAPAPPVRKRATPKPNMSLEDYLKKQK